VGVRLPVSLLRASRGIKGDRHHPKTSNRLRKRSVQTSKENETLTKQDKGGGGCPEHCRSGQMTLVLGREKKRPDFARDRHLSRK